MTSDAQEGEEEDGGGGGGGGGGSQLNYSIIIHTMHKQPFTTVQLGVRPRSPLECPKIHFMLRYFEMFMNNLCNSDHEAGQLVANLFAFELQSCAPFCIRSALMHRLVMLLLNTRPQGIFMTSPIIRVLF